LLDQVNKSCQIFAWSPRLSKSFALITDVNYSRKLIVVIIVGSNRVLRDDNVTARGAFRLTACWRANGRAATLCTRQRSGWTKTRPHASLFVVISKNKILYSEFNVLWNKLSEYSVPCIL